MKKNNEIVTCQAVVDPETNATHVMTGDIHEMFYVRLADNDPVVTCQTCKDTLVTGSKGKVACRYAPVATVRALSEFRIELINELKVVDEHCSFRACNSVLDGSKLVLRNGQEFRRICLECSSALNLIATRAQKQLDLHASGKRLLSKRDFATVDAEAKLMPEKHQVAIDAIKVLQQKASDRIKAAQRFVEAQLKPTVGKATTPKVEAKPAPKAEAKKHPLPGLWVRRYTFEGMASVRMRHAGMVPTIEVMSTPAPEPIVAPVLVAQRATEVQAQA